MLWAFWNKSYLILFFILSFSHRVSNIILPIEWMSKASQYIFHRYMPFRWLIVRAIYKMLAFSCGPITMVIESNAPYSISDTLFCICCVQFMLDLSIWVNLIQSSLFQAHSCWIKWTIWDPNATFALTSELV